jgi:hypothetical protein
MNCTPSEIAQASRCFCLPANRQRAALLYLVCAWANSASGPVPPPVTPTVVILPDLSGGFWRVFVSIAGDVYLQSDPGPATPDVILTDGGGGFFKLVADSNGDRGATSHIGPATVAPVILDSNNVAWTLVCDSLGNIGATS